MTKIAILGATGYGGGELLRFFLRTPDVQVSFATSRGQAGVPVSKVHCNLEGLTDLCFSNPGQDALLENSDIIIGALPHGASAETLAPLVDAGARVIDLSGDFRLRDLGDYKKWYGREHPRPAHSARTRDNQYPPAIILVRGVLACGQLRQGRYLRQFSIHPRSSSASPG